MPNAAPDPVDPRWMCRALRLARRGLGRTRPNPPVGAVLVSATGELLGEGFHRAAGLPHAEIEALRAASRREAPISNIQHGIINRRNIRPISSVGYSVLDIGHSNPTLYVTLEPCSSFGRTPPCTDAILAAGIARVVVACEDPNPRHAGRGVQILRDAGVRVDVGVCETEARELIAPFAKHILEKLPLVTLKLAMTLDGRIADTNGESKWITGPKARAYVQKLRRASDALLVGANTVIADDPGLLPTPRNPKFLRLILDPRGRVPPNARVFTDAHASQTLLLTASQKTTRHIENGARVMRLEKNFSLRGLLRRLAVEEDLTSILCEGGGLLAGSLAQENLVDAYELFYAPSLLLNGVPAFNAPGLALANRRNLHLHAIRRFGNDTLLRLT
ncbi:MAG: bifunctional diaminohydroxyphosphoribosylaminopyrimidine deaminase/5-amino-6-(5-phosphoribosylamino)uracil reductase RibD [Kiritimatiellaeota bacterium]|nr:bifunctional diaminohydroxyphosphoribosylaminopyrimidine deaminase/5-amino-6-(5-phosphoribosylamino)uracil reductase RibD [Kiritimatiellota bacterium]